MFLLWFKEFEWKQIRNNSLIIFKPFLHFQKLEKNATELDLAKKLSGITEDSVALIVN